MKRSIARSNALITAGATIVLVEQDIGRALGVATRVACMLEGRIILEGLAKDMTREQVTRGVFRIAAGATGNVMIWVTQLLNGVLLGGYYALLACGLSFMFGVMRIINLAHGDLAILVPCWSFVIADTTEISPFVALIVVLPVMAIIGWALQRWMLERSLRAGVLVPLLTTFGLAIVIENGLFEYFGADSRSLAPYIGDLAFDSWAITRQHLCRLACCADLRARRRVAGRIEAVSGLHLTRPRDSRHGGRPRHRRTHRHQCAAVYAVAAAIAVASAGLAGVFLAMRETFSRLIPVQSS